MSNITAVIAPSVTRTREVQITVSLDAFEPEEIAEYLRGLGFQVDGAFSRHVLNVLNERRTRKARGWSYDDDSDPEYDDGVFILASELDRLETLALCGQREVAHERLLEIVRLQREGSHL